MTKARESSDQQLVSIQASPESAEKWNLSIVNGDTLQITQDLSRKLTTITSMPRRSYGGANPFIEHLMTSHGRTKRQKTQ